MYTRFAVTLRDLSKSNPESGFLTTSQSIHFISVAEQRARRGPPILDFILIWHGSKAYKPFILSRLELLVPNFAYLTFLHDLND